MISESEAHAIVMQYIDDQCRDVPGGVAIIAKLTIQSPTGGYSSTTRIATWKHGVRLKL
jgi:hypothetical protein